VNKIHNYRNKIVGENSFFLSFRDSQFGNACSKLMSTQCVTASFSRSIFGITPSRIIPVLRWTLSDKHFSEVGSLILEAIIGIETGMFWMLTNRPSVWSRNGCFTAPRTRMCGRSWHEDRVFRLCGRTISGRPCMLYICGYFLSRSRRSHHSYAYLRHARMNIIIRSGEREDNLFSVYTSTKNSAFASYYPLHYMCSTVP
jgi:hypothetical protein